MKMVKHVQAPKIAIALLLSINEIKILSVLSPDMVEKGEPGVDTREKQRSGTITAAGDHQELTYSFPHIKLVYLTLFRMFNK